MGRFVDGEAAERSQFDNLREPAIDGFQPLERIIQRKHGYPVGPSRLDSFVDRHALHAAAAFARVVPTGAVDQDPPHDLRGNAEEMSSTPPIDLPLIDEPQVCLVDERRRLQGVPQPLAAKLAPRDMAQLAIHERQQLIERTVIPAAPVVEQRRDVLRRGRHCIPKG